MVERFLLDMGIKLRINPFYSHSKDFSMQPFFQLFSQKRIKSLISSKSP